METHLRSVVKGLSWRVIATLVTTIVVWFISGEISMALVAGAIDSLVKVGLFWGHERLWQTVTWGRKILFPKTLPNNPIVWNSSRNTMVDSSV